MRAELVDNRLLTPYLDRVGVAGHFARYVARTRPDAQSFAVSVDRRVRGVAVSGPAAELYESASTWLFADAPDVFERLLDAVRGAGWTPLNFPLSYLEVVGESMLELSVSVDRLYVLHPSGLKAPFDQPEIIHLTRDVLHALDIDDEFAPYIGTIDALADGFPMHGIVDDDCLLALAETAVRDSYVVAIQQVYTLREARRQRLAAGLVAALAQEFLDASMLPTYFVSEHNSASVRLAEMLGFDLDSRWGYAE